MALRVALDFIISSEGVISRTEEVAYTAGVSLRTLESLFSLWMKISVARYCKRVRLYFAFARWTSKTERIHALAADYHFTNITRFKRDLENFDPKATWKALPSQFYSTCRAVG